MEWNSWLIKLIAFFLAILELASGQLDASLTSPGNAFIVSVDVVNPTQDTISVLAWNNIFDFTTELPVSFSVQDDAGNAVQLASTYAMRAGVSNSDLYDMPPGQKFTRVFDLRQFLQNVPSGPTTLDPKSIKISLPSTYKGISHTGTYQIPTEAAADLTSLPPRLGGSEHRLGDFSSAGLKDITVLSNVLQTSLFFPIFPSESGPSSANDGLQLNAADCQGVTGLSEAIADAGVYANSLSLAAATSPSPLFADFFAAADQPAVSKIATSIQQFIGGTGAHADLYCTDGFKLCDASSNVLGYSFTPSWTGDAFIVLCPSARSLLRAPEPCSPQTSAKASSSISHVLFHLILTLNNVIGTVMDGTVYGAAACQQIKTSTTSVPTKNPDSYSQLAIAQWEFGLGGAPYSGASCLPANGKVPAKQRRTASRHISRSRSRVKSAPSELVARQFTATNTNIQSAMLRTELDGSSQCVGGQAGLLEIAFQNARALAFGAQVYPFAGLWNLYFNGNADVETHISNVFGKISKLDLKGDMQGITIHCDPRRQTAGCISGLTAFANWDFTNEGIIVLCPSFFYYPPSLQCLNPSAASRTDVATNTDAGGIILHELLHIPWLTDGLQIGDGVNADGSRSNCYTYECATAFTANRNKPGVDVRNLPEFVAVNYEMYAYAIRSSNQGCSWSAYPGYNYGFGQAGYGHYGG